MNERRFDQDSEPNLDHLLAEGLSSPPPEDVLREVTPWRRAMNRILWGLVLQTITLNFWGLNYLLPAVGHVLTLLGLRALRRENRAFQIWWWVTLAETGLWFFGLLHRAAPGWQAFDRTAIGWTLTGLGLALGLTDDLCLWLGLRAVRRATGLRPGAGGALALAVWQLILTVLAVSGLTQIGLISLGILLIVYVCIIRSLYKLSKELDEAGYTLRPAPVRVPDWPLAGAIWGAALLGVAAVSLAYSRLPMDWQPVGQAEHSGVEDLKAELAALGFPADVLADLSAEDIQSCGGALRVVADADEFALTNAYNDDTPKPLKITGVAVELAGEREKWRVFHHFQWDAGTSFYGTEAMQFWPAYHIGDGWAKSGPATGRVLCDRDGTAVWSPYYSLGEETFTSTSMFFGTRTSTDLFASFSFPSYGERCRGYVSYETAELTDGYIIDSWVNYAHARRMFQYPAMTAQDWIQTSGINRNSEPFFFVQTAIQFYPWTVDEEGVY